jgi:hypothetical protein
LKEGTIIDPINLQNVWPSLPASVHGDLASDWCAAENGYSVYQALGAALTPCSILEIGARVGHSLISVASENPRLRRIRWIDNESYVASSNIMAKANILGFYREFRPEWPVPEIEYTPGYPSPENLRGNFELCHIDGDHSYAGKIRDLEYCSALQPSWIIADDFEYHAEVGRAVHEWCRWMKMPLFVASSYRGLAIIPFHPPVAEWTLARMREFDLSMRRIE